MTENNKPIPLNPNDRLMRILSGETCYCLTCGEGVMKPANPDYPLRENKCFICDKCGEMLLICV